MKISVKDFIEEFQAKKIVNSKINEHAIEDYIKATLEVKEYVPFIEKRDLCEKVLNASCTKVGNIIEIDSVSRYLLFTISMITKYTALEFENNEDSDSIDSYDMLCQSGLLNYILEVIGDEYTVCNNMLNMMMADITANNTMTAVLDNAANRFLDIVDDFKDVLATKIEELDIDLDNLDLDKYKDFIDKIKN